MFFVYTDLRCIREVIITVFKYYILVCNYRHMPKFDKKQNLTLVACAAVVIVVFAFGVNIGLAALLASVLLVIFGVANDKATIKIIISIQINGIHELRPSICRSRIEHRLI